MIQRLLFNGIHLQGGRCSVAQAIKFSAAIYPDKAKTRLAFMNMAVSRTQVTVHTPICFRLPPLSFVERLRFCENR